MVHDLLFHTLLLFGILGLSMSLIWVWRQRHAATSHATTRATRRAPGHKPFPGLTRKPSSATGEDRAQEQVKASPTAPSPMVTIRGCPRTVDTCSGLRTVPLGLANKGVCGPAIGANTRPLGPTLMANEPTLG